MKLEKLIKKPITVDVEKQTVSAGGRALFSIVTYTGIEAGEELRKMVFDAFCGEYEKRYGGRKTHCPYCGRPLLPPPEDGRPNK
jgi:hypothetical protein